jgi:NADH dehydrogenase (ubiquinone) flavoprotein 2
MGDTELRCEFVVVVSHCEHLDTSVNNESVPFDFTSENWEKAKVILDKYPENYKRSALMPLMDLAQRQYGGWIPISAMNKVAKICDVAPMQAYEVASFYTMYNRYELIRNFF